MNIVYRKLPFTLALLQLLLFSHLTFAQKAKKEDQAISSQIDATFTQFFPADQPGGVVLVVKDGKTILRKGYGLADVEKKTPSSPDNIYKIGSITKQFTAAAILML
jgi:D-alanyl-D-alanine carboxypeptidase